MENLRIAVNGLHMGVTTWGDALPHQQTLVLLHGFTGSAASWSALLPDLQTAKHRVVALDLLGHGQSDAPADPTRYSIEHCRADLLAVLRSLGVASGEAILLGYSMGGRMALYAACSGFFRALILESASPGLDQPAEREERRQSDNALAARIERAGIEAFVNEWEQLPLFASLHNLPPKVQTTLRSQRLHNSPTGLANSLRGAGTGTQPSLYARLPTLTLPVLLLAGELDKKFCTLAREMARQLPQAHLQLVPSAGHTIHLEQPEMFTRLVHRFCETLC